MKIDIQTKRFALRASAIACALYAIEPTRQIFSGILEFKIGPVSIITIAGVLTAIFVWGHIKRWW